MLPFIRLTGRRALVLSLFSLAPAAGAQDVQVLQHAAEAQRLEVSGVPRHYRYDLDTGAIQFIGEEPSFAGVGDPPCFANDIDNNDAGGTVADALLVAAGQELIDWGVKFCNQTGLVESIRIGYASTAGSVGGKLRINVYAGAQGFGIAGTEVARIELEGLPADAVAFFTPYYMDIDLGSQAFFLPDGPIGWGFMNGDDTTAPLLVDVHPSPSTQNFIDWYAPGPASRFPLFATFQLTAGGGSNDPYENSLYIVLNESTGTLSASVQAVPSGSNSKRLSAQTGPVLGSAWTLDFDLDGLTGNVTTRVFLSTGLTAAKPTPFGDLLLDPVQAFDAAAPTVGGGHAFAIPADAALLGLTVYAQGTTFSAEGRHLTNAVAGTIGF